MAEARDKTTRTIRIEVLRYRPEQDERPVWQGFDVPYTDDMSVLQGIQYIKDELDGSLSFRWSCRMAICGSCGMMIEGRPKLSCRTFLRDYAGKTLHVEPLAHFPIERDLVVGLEDFIDKLESIKPYLVPNEKRALSEGEYLQTPAQRGQYEQFSLCINCTLCYAACPQYGMNSEFMGPGVLALLHRYNADSRDGAAAERMEIVGAQEGVWNCTAVAYCSEVCPEGVDPAKAVNLNKVNAAKNYFLGIPGKKKETAR
jgi:fumarate reductase iron-sulfur subunit